MSEQADNVVMSVNDGSISLEEGANVNQAEQTAQPAQSGQTEQRTVDVNKEVTVPLHLLINLRQIIDVSVNRGTYRSNELTSVGKVYDSLTDSLKPHLA